MSGSNPHIVISADRRTALRRAGLGEASDHALERITKLVCAGLRVPVSLISLIDGHRQFFACAQGLEEPWASRLETPLSHSFCKHVVTQGKPLVVSDARLDPRLSANLAVSELKVVAYLGVPLVSPTGEVLGTLCAVDDRPRDWTDADTELLNTVGAVFTDHLVLLGRTEQLERTAESLARLRVFSDRSSESQLIVDKAGAIVSVNRTACERLGYSAEELTRRPLSDIQPDATGGVVAEMLERSRTHPLEPYETQHRRQDGSLLPVEVTVATISSGEVEHLAITASDITERQRRVAALADRESRLRFALDAGAMGAWDWDVRERRIGISERQGELLGLPPGCVDLDEEQAVAFIHPDDRDRVIAEATEAIARDREFEVECRVTTGDGEVRWLLARGHMMLDAMERPARLLGVTLDVTERRATFDELRIRDERIRALLDSTAEGIYGLDLEGLCTFANESCARLLGYRTPDELLGRNMHTLIHHHRSDGQVYPESECPIFRSFRRDEGVHIDNEVLFRKDGTSFPAEYWSYPIRRDGRRVGAVVTFLDISERIDAQRRVVESEQFLRSSIDALSTHVAILDERGRIIRTNRAWNDFAAANGGDAQRTGELISYIDVCDRAGATDPAPAVAAALREMLRGAREEFEIEYPCDAIDCPRWFLLRLTRFETASGVRIVAAHDNITSRKLAELRLQRRTEMLSQLNEANRALAAELDLEHLITRVTEVATALCGAAFGAFFYNVDEDRGGSYMLYSVAGAPRSKFDHLPMPRATDVFGPTFRGERPIRLDDVTRDPRYGRNTPFHGMPDGHLEVRSYLAVPVVTRNGEVLGGLFFGHPEVGVFSDNAESLVTGVAAQAAVMMDNARLYRDVRRREEDYRGTFENAAVGMAHVGLDGVMLRANDRLGAILRRDAASIRGTPFSALLQPDDRERADRSLSRIASGDASRNSEELRYRRDDGAVVWVLQTASLVVDDEGRASYVALIVQDITDRKQAQEHQDLLLRELSHRVKNLLATVASIASQTLRQSDDLDTFAEAFQGRLSALANVHTLLVRTDWKGASLDSIVDRNFAPYAKDREDAVRCSGDDVFLRPRAALALSLVLHELTTNAIKYGALSRRDGAIRLTWHVEQDDDASRLVVEWTERGGPRVEPPSTTGFGTTLIEKGIEFELDGDARLEYQPEGVTCRLDIPWTPDLGKQRRRRKRPDA